MPDTPEEYSPFPWSAPPEQGGFPEYQNPSIVYDRDGIPVIAISQATAVTAYKRVSRANARLIACLPLLLETIKEIHECSDRPTMSMRRINMACQLVLDHVDSELQIAQRSSMKENPGKGIPIRASDTSRLIPLLQDVRETLGASLISPMEQRDGGLDGEERVRPSRSRVRLTRRQRDG